MREAVTEIHSSNGMPTANDEQIPVRHCREKPPLADSTSIEHSVQKITGKHDNNKSAAGHHPSLQTSGDNLKCFKICQPLANDPCVNHPCGSWG
jgi:hypothetical protein